jgi:hypothetical protein
MDTIHHIDKYYNCIITDDDDQRYYVSSKELPINGLNHWVGWKCFTGTETLIIDYDQKIYNGICRQLYMGDLNTNTDLQLPQSYIICKNKSCTLCPHDLLTTKYK